MSGKNNKTKFSMLLAASLITANFVCATDAYKNNVVDVRVNKESGNAVKVTIFTDKPYSEPVVVNKKANNKYVILMPETKNSLKTSPTVINGAGTISDVTVNTQEVSGGKGYTKIVITSEKTITVVPKTQQLKSSAKVASAPVVQKNNAPTTKVSAPVQKVEKPKKQETSKDNQVAKKKDVSVNKNAISKNNKSLSASPAPKKVSVPAEVKKQPIEILEQEIKTGQYAQIKQESNDEVLNNEINENIKLSQNENDKNKKSVLAEENNKTVIENIKSVIRDYQNVSMWKLLLLASAITFPLIVILLILGLDKKINKKIDKSFKKEEDYAPQLEESSDNIEPQKETLSYGSFDEMLDKVEEHDKSFHQEQLKNQHVDESEVVDVSTTGKIEEMIDEVVATKSVENEFSNDFSDSDFENNFSGVESPEYDYVENNDIVENDIDITDENEYLPTESQDVAEIPPTVVEQYNPDGYLSDFDSIDDSDFFDELAMQTMADNNAQGLPPESPADEIFNFMSEKENVSAPKEDFKEEIAIPEVEVAQDVVAENTGVIENIQDVSDDISDIELQNEGVTTEEYSEGDLTMLTEVKLNESTSLYLVNYDNFSSLVGHIEDNYFVIKKFDEIVNARIFLKETEKLKDATRYLVRVGKNKMVVEVTDNSMSRLLDL